GQPHRVGVHKGRGRLDDLHPVTLQLVARHVYFVPNDLVCAEQQVGQGDVLLDGVRGAVEAALAIAREVQHGLAQRFAGDGAGVDAHAAHHRLALHDGHALVELGRLDGRPLPGRSRADHQKVEVVVCHGVRPRVWEIVRLRARVIVRGATAIGNRRPTPVTPPRRRWAGSANRADFRPGIVYSKL